MDPQREPVVVSVARSAIGRAFKGSLIDVRPDDLCASMVRHAVADIDPAEVVDVVVGAANHAGEQSMNLGRTVSLLAGLPVSVPGATVNRGCGSSVQAIRMAQHAIMSGEGEAFVAAGVESVSRLPGFFDESVFHPRFVDPAEPNHLAQLYISMGETAENVADRYGLTRRELDEFAELSQQRAAQAGRAGFWAREITPYTRVDGVVVAADDSPRENTTVEGLSRLTPAFRSDGVVTAGNSCPLNDGAAAALIMSRARAAALGLTPLARILGSAVTGLEPEYMGLGPVTAVRQVLERCGLTIADVDVVEINEAFASQVLASARELGIDVGSQLNPHGGAIAVGHPFGMTGVRILATLINDLQTLDRTIGVETLCIGGGMGMALVLERLS